MKLNEKWWTPANWDNFDNGQRKKTVEWCEEHLGKYFGLEANYCNKYVKPPVARNKRFSTLGNFSEERIGYYPNSMMEKLVWILGCWNPIRFSLFHIETAPMNGNYFIDYLGKFHRSEDGCRRADEEFRRLFPQLFAMLGEEKMNEIKMQKTESATEYRVISPNGELTEMYNSLDKAAGRAMHLSAFYFNGIFGGNERITQYCDFKNLDFMKENSFEVPKIKQTSRFLYEFENTSYIDRLGNPEQDEEFHEFLRTL